MCASREKCAHYLQGEAIDDIRLCGEEENPMVVKEIPPIVRVVKKEEREDETH